MAYIEFDGELDEPQAGGFVEFTGELDQEVARPSEADLTKPFIGARNPRRQASELGGRTSADPRRLDSPTGAKIADDVAFLSDRREKLKQANAGTKATPEQIESLAQFETANRGQPSTYGFEDRVSGYKAKGLSDVESTRNAVFDATLEQRLNEPFQKAAPSATGERISTSYQPEREAERTRKQGDDLASLRDDLIGRNAAGEMNASLRGMAKGGIQSAALTAGTIGYLGDVFGSDALKQWGLEKYDRGMKLANQLTLSKGASDIRSADDLTEWLAENAGYVAYQAAEAIITGGVGSAVGKQVGKEALVTAVGLGLNSMRQTLGSVYGEAIDEAKATGKPMPSLLQVFGGAAASAAVDALADKIGLDAITAKGFKGNVLSRVGKSVGGQMAVQGGTEAVQLVPEEWGAGRDPFREGMGKQYFDEAAVGALGGAGPGVMGAIARNPQDQIASALTRELEASQVPSESVRAAAVEQERAKLASLRASAISNIGAAQSVDEAIAAAQVAVNLPTSGPLERLNKRINDADLLAKALGDAGIDAAAAPVTAEPITAQVPDEAPAPSAQEPLSAPVEPAVAPSAEPVQASPMVMGRPVSEIQIGQLLQISKSSMFPDAVREVARQEVKRREIDAMYAQRDLAPQAKAAQEQTIIEAARDERVDQAVALTSAQTVDAPTAMQLAFQRAQAKKVPAQIENANVQNTAPAAAATQTAVEAAPVEAATAPRTDGATAAGVPQPGAAASVEAAGVAIPSELGRNNQPISEGGKPFKTRAEVDAAKKLQPLMRVKKVKGGYILTQKTPAQIAAQAKAARRLGGTGVTGAMAAHELLASLGGLSKSTMADLGFDRNVRVGARWLFSGTGGLSLERATEALQQHGYMDGTDQAQGISIIQRSSKGDPQYTAEGWEQVAKAEAEARYEDHLSAQEEAAQSEDFDPFASLANDGYVIEDAEAAGLAEATPAQLTEILAGIDHLEAIGQDLDSIAERIALQYPDASQQEYHELVQDAINQAIDQAAQPAGSRDDGQAGGGETAAPAAEAEPVVAESSLLSSPTRADIEAQQERADTAARQEATDRQRAEQEDAAARERAEVARRSEAAADTFELGQDPMANLTGQQDIFGASRPEPETPAQPKPAAPRASQPKTETPRLTDAGEELIRNRRGKLKGLAWDDVSSMNDTLKVAQVVKANVWPRPDYAKMVEAGAPAWKAAALKAVYDKLAAAPVTRTTPTDADLRSYIETLAQIRELLTAELDRVAAMPDGAELWKTLKSENVFDKAFPVPADARPMFGRPSPFDRVSEQGKANNKRALLIGGNGAIQALQFDYKMRNKVKDLLAQGFPAKQEAWQKSWEVRATETRNDDVPEAERTGEPQQRFYVYEKGSRWRLAKNHQDGGYATQEQAEAFARSLTARTRETLPPSRGLDLADARRTGPDWREGKDVTAQDIMDHFGFRGVNLGEYVKAKQGVAQLHLNHVYDAFNDLADLMGVPPKAMSLDGTLGVAIGAQGSGKALAHFVPGVNEINITRDAGAGALAHEFGHALDHYFATQHGRATSMAKRPYLSAVVQTLSDPGGVRSEVMEAMRTVMRTINTRPMTEAEARQYLEDQRTRNRKYLDRWVREFSGNKGADPAALKAVAEKLARGELGDPVDGDLEANLIEFMRAANLKPGNAIASNPITVAYRLRDLADEDRFLKTHIPQTDTNYSKASDAMDAKKAGGEGYWSTPWEKFARAFETFAMDALKSRDRESLYLSGLVDSDGWRDWSEATAKAIPFPMGDERLALQQAFQKLVDTIQTKETEQGVMMYARDAGFNDAVDAAVNAAMKGEKPSRQNVKIGTTPPALIAAGIPSGEMQTSPSVLAKVVFDHGVPKSLLKKVPDLLENPVMVFDSDTVAGSYAVVTNEFVNGKPLLVIVSPEQTRGGVTFNFVPSLYPKDHLVAIQKWLDTGKLRYLDKKQSPSWFGSSRLQLPTEYRSMKGLQARNVATELDLVKADDSALSRPFDADMFSRIMAPMPTSLPVSEVREAVDEVAATWKNAPSIRIVATPAELPQRNAPANARGAYDGKTVWIVAGNHRNAGQVFKTLAHEAIAHHGLRGILGDQWSKTMQVMQLALKSGNKALGELRDEVRAAYVDEQGKFNLTPQQEADEIAARAVERAIDPVTGEFRTGMSWLKSTYARVATWLREIGIPLTFTNFELQGMLSNAQAYLRDGDKQLFVMPDSMAEGALATDEASLQDGVAADTPAFARSNPAVSRFRLDPENWRGKTRRVMQDYFLRVRRVQEAIASQGGLVDETTDTYLAEELSYGRIQESLKDFANKMVKPMIEKAQAAGIDMDELALYAYAKHAKERNAQIARIDPKMPDGGSGMTDAEADAILAKAAAKQGDFDSLHADLMAMTATTRQTLWQEGLITEDEFNALDGMYDNYVPLRGFELKDEDGKPSGLRAGKGFNVRGKETMRALGRQSRAGDVIENIIADYERAVVRAERNQVAKVFLNFVLQNPDASLWEVDATRTKKALDRQTGLVARDTAIEKGEDTIAVKVAGREVYVQIHDDLLARAMRNAHKDETGEAERALIKTVGMYATLMRNTLTRFNPEFALVNTVRDFGFGTAAALDKLGEKGAAKFVKHYAGAYAASARAELGKGDPASSAWDKWFEEYRAAGGTTGGFYTKGADEIRADIRTILLQAGAAPKDWKEKIQASGPMQFARAAGRVLEFAGAASENAARVAAYRTAREMGKSPSEAASIAKNLTTNFNRRGEAGQLLNSLFVFYNAAIQGAQRTAAMFKNPKMRGYLAAGTAGALGLALANATAGGDDEDDGQAYWDKIPDYVKERNLIIMLPPGTEMDGTEKVGTKGRYIAIPVQYGLNIFTVLGYNAADLIRHSVDETRGKNWLQAGVRAASTAFGSFNPFGGGMDNVHSAAMTVMPSVLDVVYQYAAGVNGFGRPTSPFKGDFDTSPDSENVNARQSGGIAHRVARWVNSVTGGDEAEPGLVDMAPGTIEQTWRNLTGGTGMFIGDVLTIAAKQIDDQFGAGENDYFVRDIPILRKVFGEADGDVDQSLFYERRREINEARTVEKRKAELGREFTDRRQIALASMATDGNKFARALSDIRKEMVEIGKDGEMSDTEKKVRLRELKAERDDLTREFNRVFMDTMRDMRDGAFDVEPEN